MRVAPACVFATRVPVRHPIVLTAGAANATTNVVATFIQINRVEKTGINDHQDERNREIMSSTLSTTIHAGITLTPTGGYGTYQSPFTITDTGAIIAGSGTYGVFGSVTSGSLTLLNDGLVQGGSSGEGDGVYLNSGILTNSGTITGGGNSYAGYGVQLSYGILSNSGTITGGNGSDHGGKGVELVSGTLTNHGIITGGNGSYYGGNGVDLKSSTLTNYGTITGGSANTSSGSGVGVYIDGSSTLIDSGKIVGGTGVAAVLFYSLYSTNAGTLVVEAGASFVGGVVADPKISDVLAIGGTSAVSLVGLGTAYEHFHTLAFDTGATGNVSGTYTAFSGLNVISFALGDTLVLDGFAETSDTYVSGNGLVLSNGSTGTSSQITLDITGSFATSNFTVGHTLGNTTISLNSMPCFAAGTRILTTRGEIQVEQMQEGTSVILADGRIVPITWIGHRTIDIARHPHPETVRPVLIMAGAISDGIPARDLYLSPDHAVALDGHLIPAKTLINGSTIRQVDRRTVTYYHVELPEHAVLWAEGTPCESYLETGNRHSFENSDAPVIALHPAFGPTTSYWQRVREARSCAPLIEEGSVVEAVRARLLSRANVATTPDADLSITSRADGSIAITSRSTIPGYLAPDPRDRRLLGVKIASIIRKDGTLIPLDHPDLVTGWHDAEPDGRWTNGHALIPASLVGDGLADIALAATLAYSANQKQADNQPRFGSLA